MRTMKKALVVLLVAMMVLSVTVVQAQAKSYKAGKVTAKQIVTQLKKTCLVKKVFRADSVMDPKTPNVYKSKYNFTDRKYSKVYCTVEVFRDNYDAARRQAYMDTLSYVYNLFDVEEDIPLQAYRYKNVLLRVGSQMPLNRCLKYYNAIKKMIK